MTNKLMLLSVLLGCGASSSESAAPPRSELGEPGGQGELGEPGVQGEPETSAPGETTEIWTIAADRVDCQGVGPQRCMRVRRGDEEWTLLYDRIEGLDADEGTEYSVRVREEEVENPPADSSSIRVILVEVLSESPGSAQPPAGCTSSSDCAQGQQCLGPEGCDVAWTCQPARACTRDLRPYCTCDGRTVRGSGSCPPEPYRSRGACGGTAAP